MENMKITKLTIGEVTAETTRADLIFNEFGPSWSIQADSDLPDFTAYPLGNEVDVVLETEDGELTGKAKVLRTIGLGPLNIELFGVSESGRIGGLP